MTSEPCRWCSVAKRECDADRQEHRKCCPDCQHGHRTKETPDA